VVLEQGLHHSWLEVTEATLALWRQLVGQHVTQLVSEPR